MCSRVNIEKGYLFPRKLGLTVIQRSRTHPYLWIRLGRDESGYVAGGAGSSMCAINWADCSWFKGDRRPLGCEAVSCRIQKERGEEEKEEE